MACKAKGDVKHRTKLPRRPSDSDNDIEVKHRTKQPSRPSDSTKQPSRPSDSTKQPSRLSNSDSDNDITISCWNIMGSSARGFAALREKVTTATFRHKSLSTKTRLGEADIICLQETTFNPTSKRSKKARKYLPFVCTESDYEVKCQGEKGNRKYTSIFFRKETFFLITESDLISQAFHLMKIKWEVYKEISRGGTVKQRQVDQGQCPPWGQNKNKSMCEEVLKECEQESFEDGIKKYIGSQDGEPQSPEKLLRRRMEICCLQHKDFDGEYRLVVISIHNYSTGIDAPENYAHLLFDFLDKIEAPVVIAGDFNFDIKQEPSLGTFLLNYSIINYRGAALRHGLPRIDFVCLKDYTTSSSSLTTTIKDTEAHDLQVPLEVKAYRNLIKLRGEVKEKDITNHNPLSATLVVTPEKSKALKAS